MAIMWTLQLYTQFWLLDWTGDGLSLCESQSLAFQVSELDLDAQVISLGKKKLSVSLSDHITPSFLIVLAVGHGIGVSDIVLKYIIQFHCDRCHLLFVVVRY